MSNQNKLFIAAAGAGKTTFIVREALKIKDKGVLITTYTEANEAEIKKKLVEENKSPIPQNIKVQTWFSFLIQHGVRPYQGTCNNILFSKRIRGLDFVMEHSGIRFSNNHKNIYWGENNFKEYYFDNNDKIYSDKLSKFVFRSNENSNGDIIDRLSRIFPYIFIDEIQDLAGYDLELLQLLFNSKINLVIVGDPRQVIYLTHHERKYNQYKDGKIKEFIFDQCKELCLIDEDKLKKSHRNNKQICDFSSRLYPNLPISEPCQCEGCHDSRIDHQGIFIVRNSEVKRYLNKYKPIILRYEKSIFPEWNFGKSKGLGFERVLIFPTNPIIKYLKDGLLTKIVKNKEVDAFDISKFYVALTRAKYSVGIVYDYSDSDKFIAGITKWNSSQLF